MSDVPQLTALTHTRQQQRTHQCTVPLIALRSRTPARAKALVSKFANAKRETSAPRPPPNHPSNEHVTHNIFD
eukprot:296494-Amphidinium_carterae.1